MVKRLRRHRVVTILPDRATRPQKTQADRIDQLGLAVVLSPRIREFVTGGDAAIVRFLRACGLGDVTVVPFGAVAETVDDTDFVIIPEDDWRTSERVWVDVIRAMHPDYQAIAKVVPAAERGDRYYADLKHSAAVQCLEGLARKVQIGNSGGIAEGWTDGRTFIAFDRQFLERQPMSADGLLRVMGVYFHEVSHTADDAKDSAHSIEFYRRFHDLSTAATGSSFVRLLAVLLRRGANAAGQARLKTQRKNLGKASEAFLKIGRELLSSYEAWQASPDGEAATPAAPRSRGKVSAPEPPTIAAKVSARKLPKQKVKRSVDPVPEDELPEELAIEIDFS